MENLNVDIISQYIYSSIDSIEEQIDAKIMFGAVGGSYSLGLYNSSSDIDCYFLVDSKRNPYMVHGKTSVKINGKNIDVDTSCVDFEEMLFEIYKYKNMQKQYPTVLYRTEEEERSNMLKASIERPDWKRCILSRILLSDNVINQEIAKAEYTKYRDGIRIIDILDDYYTRIYADYKNNIRNTEYVPIRKYLYTIHRVCSCKSLMHSEKKPPLDFIKLINCIVENSLVKETIYSWYEINRHTKDKNKEQVYKNDRINQFIIESMDCICNYLKRNAYICDYLQF